MIRSLFSSFSSRPHQPEPRVPMIYETLTRACEENDLTLMKDVTVFTKRDSAEIPLLLLDPYRGLFVFDIKSWDYAYLKDAKAKAAVQKASRHNNIRVDAHQAIITQKFNEVLHHDGCAVTNFVLLERLTEAEFDRLDDSFSALMPKQRVLFADESMQSILQKLQTTDIYHDTPLVPSLLLGELLIQFGILPNAMHPKMRLATAEQQQIITHPLSDPVTQLVGTYGSGKSTVLLLKAVYEALKNPRLRIILLEPTLTACEAQKRRLLQLSAHALVDIDAAAIQILTPQQLIALHFSRLYKKSAAEEVRIDPKMMNSSFDIADLILCDDASLLDDATIRYLLHIQNRNHLLLATVQSIDDELPAYTLSDSFRCNGALLSLIATADEGTPLTKEDETVRCISGNPYLHTLLRVAELLQKKEPKAILILCENAQMADALLDEINAYIGETAELLHALKHHQKGEEPKVLIAEAANASGLESDAVILCGLCNTKPELLRYALGRASESMTVILDENCENNAHPLQHLKESSCKKQ